MPEELERKVGSLTKGACPECKRKVNATVQANVNKTICWDDEHGLSSYMNYQVLSCGGCGHNYYRTIDSFSEAAEPYYGHNGEILYEENPTYSYWPPSEARTFPDWMQELEKKHSELVDVCSECYSAFTGKQFFLVGMGLRTAFDMALLALNIHEGSYEDKIKAALKDSLIDEEEYNHFNVLIEVGNASVHRGWKITDPTEINALFDILEAFLRKHFIDRPKRAQLSEAVQAIGSKIPPNTRSRKANPSLKGTT